MRKKARVKKPTKAIKKINNIARQLKQASNKVKVGVAANANDYPDGTSVVMVAATHEFGSTDGIIPQRSFMYSTFNNNVESYRKLLKKLGTGIATGKITADKALGIVGLQFQVDIQQTITDIESPPLKYRQGSALVDTGHLRQSITYQLTGGNDD